MGSVDADPDRLLTPQQVATILGYPGDSGARHVRRLIERGQLTGENHGTGSQKAHWRIPLWAVREYQRGRSVAHTEIDGQDGHDGQEGQ